MQADRVSVQTIADHLGASIQSQALCEAFGYAIIAADPSVALDALDPSHIVQLYKLSGALLFRGFNVTVVDFENFTNKFTTNYTVNGSLTRTPVSADGITQTVNAGAQLIPPHAEMAYTPFRPDMLWFYCATPASRGGETLVCDGLDVWSHLNAPTKDLFLNRNVTYKKKFSNAQHDLDSMALLWFGQTIDVSKMGDKLADIPNATFRAEEDGFRLDYTVSAVQKPKHHESLAFANSVIVEDRSCFFENGEAISRDLRLELFYEATNCSLQHKWQSGDILMVDNSRMMHGRASFSDPGRNGLVRMGREAF